jgi:CheY-like chemotaxis protein
VTLRPDVLVMDIQMPDMNGLDATRDVRRAAPDVAVLMLTMFDDDESVFAAMRAGAHGYVLKGAEPEDTIRAISAVAAGEVIFGAGVARRALGYLTAPRSHEPAFPELTRRERSVWPAIPSATTSRTSSPSSRWPAGRRPSCGPASPVWAADRASAVCCLRAEHDVEARPCPCRTGYRPAVRRRFGAGLTREVDDQRVADAEHAV